MDLNSIDVAIRPRRHWESIDLGLRLAREHWRALFVPWLLALVPLAAVVLLLLRAHMGWAVLAIWWMKPLLERIPLYVLSRAVFGSPPRARNTLAALPGMLRRGAFVAITLRRFDLARSFSMPVWQLEGLSGKLWRQRLRTLERNTRGVRLLTLCCLGFEAVLWMSLLALIAIMTPEQLAVGWLDWLWEGTAPSALSVALWVASVALVGPFYVAGGFGLYLNRRAELEGWDIEIAFRRMALRLDAEPREAA